MSDTLPFAELAATSNFSFLEGASRPEELIARAAELGLVAVAIADLHTMAGVVRAHVAAKEHGVQLVVGTRCQFQCGADTEPGSVELVLLAGSIDGYSRMCRLLTLGKRRAGWTLEMDCNIPALESGVETRSAARNASACHLWLHDLLDASVQSIGSGEPGAEGGRVPGADRPLAPFAIPDVHAIIMPPRDYGVMQAGFLETLRWLGSVFDHDRISLGFPRLSGDDATLKLLQLEWLSLESNIPLIATNDPCCHHADRQQLQDILTAIRAHRTVAELRTLELRRSLDAAHGNAWNGPRLKPDANGYLTDARGLRAMLGSIPQDVFQSAISRTVTVADRCKGFNMSMIRYQYPREVAPPGIAPLDYLRTVTEQGAERHWPHSCGGVPAKVRAQLEHEFQVIKDLDYACYFLTVHAIVSFAKGQSILCQGRGAAANSAVCFCLGITAVDPSRSDMLFERFISRERDEPPDIDVDFEHERREEVIQFIYRTWGRARAALCAEVVCWRGRSALREVGKALGIPADLVARIAGATDWWEEGLGIEGVQRTGRPVHAIQLERLKEIGVDPTDPKIIQLFTFAGMLLGFPRHLSQHVGGFIITDGPLCELVPVRNASMDARTIVEWDKDDVEAMGMLKMDVLALGMLTAIRKAIDIGNESPVPGWPSDPSTGRMLEYHTVPSEDPDTYAMASRADTVGVFQIESRAQMSMLPRLRPKCFYDLVIQVAIVRPGPIQGDMVHPYLLRRDGIEEPIYPSEAIRSVLGKTLGVPLFQEQAMSLAVVAAGFSAGEADQLRRAIAAWKRSGNKIAMFGERLQTGMRARGYSALFAEQVFRQIQGFSGYGFPESHAASFALLVYVSAWLKRHHPAAFTAALLNSQPMGFYAPAQLVRDAREHGVEVRPVDALRSGWDCSLEDASDGIPTERCASTVFRPRAIRLGLRMISGLRREDADAIVSAVRAVPETEVSERGTCANQQLRGQRFTSVEALWRASECSLHALRKLAAADAYISMGVPRQQALWQVRALRGGPAPVLDAAVEDGGTLFDMSPQPLPPVPPLRAVAADYASTGLSLGQHPITFLRKSMARRGAVQCASLATLRSGSDSSTLRLTAVVGGLVLCRQRPSTASGIVFVTIEDESGVANLIIRPRVYERIRSVVRHATALLAEGVVECRSGVTHLLVRRVTDLSGDLEELASGDAIAQPSRNFR